MGKNSQPSESHASAGGDSPVFIAITCQAIWICIITRCNIYSAMPRKNGISHLPIVIAALAIAASAGTGASVSAATRAGFYKRLDRNTYLLNLLPGAKLVESLKAFQKATGTRPRP